MDDFRAARLTVDKTKFVPHEVRERIEKLPTHVQIRDRDVDIDYDVEEQSGERRGVARLRLPEKIARTLTEDEIPRLDRPIRFVVLRGQRGAVRAETLSELQSLLAQPWSPDEVEESAEDRALQSHAEREVRRIADEFREHRNRGFRNRDDPRKRGRGGQRGGASQFKKRRRGR